MLTEQEKMWLKKRKGFRCRTCQDHAPLYSGGKLIKLGCRTDFEKGCPFYRPLYGLDNYRDAAEFEARVVVKLTMQERCPLPKGARLDDCPYFNEDNVSSFSCSWCAVKRARIAVEEEMEIGVSQSDLAKYLKSRGRASELVTGKRYPSKAEIAILRELLGISADMLIPRVNLEELCPKK